MTVTAKCIRCHKPFQYEPAGNRVRQVCPGCQKANGYAHNRRNKEATRLPEDEEQADRQYKRGTILLSREDVAWRLGLSEEGVALIERKALAKIRKHPAARQLYSFWKAEGAPTPPPGPEAGELLLNMQMELSRMREVYEVLSDPEEGTPEEAAEYKKQIENFEWELSKAIRKLVPE